MDRETKHIAKTGLRIEPVFTKAESDPFAQIHLDPVNVEGKTIYVPDSWPTSSHTLAASLLFSQEFTNQQGETKPGENSVLEAIERTVSTWRWWGDTYGYFYRKTDALTFATEMRYLLAHQFITPGLSHWRKSGIRFAYNLKGDPDPQVVYIDPETKLVHPVNDAYSHPVLQDFALANDNLGNFASEIVLDKEQSTWLSKPQLPTSNQNPVTNQSGAYIAPLHTAFFNSYLNLPKFFDPVSDEFNFEWYTQAVRLTTIALDISILFAGYPDERTAVSTAHLRPLAITNSGIAEVIANSDLQIDTDSKLELIAGLQATATLEALTTSAELAKVLDHQVMPAAELTQLDLGKLGESTRLGKQEVGENISLIKKYGLHNWQLTNLHQDPEINSLLGAQTVQLNFANEQAVFPDLLNSLTGGIDTDLYQNAQLTDVEAKRLQRPVKVVLSQAVKEESLKAIEKRIAETEDIATDSPPAPLQPALTGVEGGGEAKQSRGEKGKQPLTPNTTAKGGQAKPNTQNTRSVVNVTEPKAHSPKPNSLSHKFILSETLIGYLTLIFAENGTAREIVIHPFNASLEHRFIYDLSSKFINLLLKQGGSNDNWEAELAELVPSGDLEQVMMLVRYTIEWVQVELHS